MTVPFFSEQPPSLDEALWARVLGGDVVLDGEALGVRLAIPPWAARETARRLLAAAEEAEASRAHLCE